MKICQKCNQYKPLTQYNKNKSKKDGLDIYCKGCVIENSKKYRPERIILLPQDPNNKICVKCSKEKSKTEFSKMKSQTDSLNYWCRVCVKEDRKYKSWNLNQYSTYKNYRRTWNNNQYNSDLNYKLIINFRCRMNSILKKQSTQKNNTSLKYLGCSLEEYKQHLEKQFKPDMNWDNHGVIWEVDHIYPCSKFDLTIEKNIYECFNYINTQPLHKSENRSKKDKIIDDIIK
jgi:hypothetical protein